MTIECEAEREKADWNLCARLPVLKVSSRHRQDDQLLKVIRLGHELSGTLSCSRLKLIFRLRKFFLLFKFRNLLVVQAPGSQEWDSSGLPEYRRAYLDSGLSFEEIAARLVDEAKVLKAWIGPYRNPPKGTPKQTRQACFLLRIRPPTYDLFYNAPDGLRGRYWQSPTLGDDATCSLISSLNPKLLEYATKKPPKVCFPAADMNEYQIKDSLDKPSAKVWVREWDDDENFKIDLTGTQLIVRRWRENENENECEDFRKYWRWTPIDDGIEVKGALLTPDGNEAVPEKKKYRSIQINRFGFT